LTGDPTAPADLRNIDSPAPAVTRAAAVLDVLAHEAGPVPLTDIARRLGLAKSSVANICAAMEGVGLVRRVGGRWALGYRLVELGAAFLAGADIVGEFHRACNELATAGQETLLLAQLEGTDIVYLARHDGTQPIRLASDVGRRMPAVVTALGKAMLASLPDDELRHRLASIDELPVVTERSHRTMAALTADLEEIRERGYSVDDEQNTLGVTCYGVALARRTRTPPPYAVSVTLLSPRRTDALRDALVSDLHSLADRLALTSGR
jgi:DNA-binding IclR family transcriptional regulator